MSWDKERVAQIQLPDPADVDPHPRLLLEGRGIHAGPVSYTHLDVYKRQTQGRVLRPCSLMGGTRLPWK